MSSLLYTSLISCVIFLYIIFSLNHRRQAHYLLSSYTLLLFLMQSNYDFYISILFCYFLKNCNFFIWINFTLGFCLVLQKRLVNFILGFCLVFAKEVKHFAKFFRQTSISYRVGAYYNIFPFYLSNLFYRFLHMLI